MSSTGPAQTYFVVASTDMQHVPIMMARIRGQLEKLEELNTQAEFELAALEIPLSDLPREHSLQQQVEKVAEIVTIMTQAAMGLGSSSAAPSN